MHSERGPDAIARRVAHILSAIDTARGYVRGVSRESFLNDQMRQDAVARQLLIIAEACDRIAEVEQTSTMAADRTLAVKHPHIPWRAIRGMGVRIRHGYDRIEAAILWDTVTGSDLDDVQKALRAG